MKTALMILMFVSFSLQLLADEACYAPNNPVHFNIYAKSGGPITKIEMYRGPWLILRDFGGDFAFQNSPCHVDGGVAVGEFLTYGGCAPFGEKLPKKIQIKNTDIVYDLNHFNCYPLVESDKPKTPVTPHCPLSGFFACH